MTVPCAMACASSTRLNGKRVRFKWGTTPSAMAASRHALVPLSRTSQQSRSAYGTCDNHKHLISLALSHAEPVMPRVGEQPACNPPQIQDPDPVDLPRSGQRPGFRCGEPLEPY